MYLINTRINDNNCENEDAFFLCDVLMIPPLWDSIFLAVNLPSAQYEAGKDVQAELWRFNTRIETHLFMLQLL